VIPTHVCKPIKNNNCKSTQVKNVVSPSEALTRHLTAVSVLAFADLPRTAKTSRPAKHNELELQDLKISILKGKPGIK
jgi:hypothetical protein